jgi:ribosomal protein S18 acetylase RimI-like enzyme
VKDILFNPVYNSLVSGDRHLGSGTDKVKIFDQEVSPFAGFEDDYEQGFSELSQLISDDRVILFATPTNINIANGWKMLHKIPGLQMVFDQKSVMAPEKSNILPLQKNNVDQMMSLATLTKPGPFGPRTIEFGQYYGIFDGEQLVAMAGQRLHVNNYTEISAVCTHPDYLGRGYAASLIVHQIQLILSQSQTPFLHVRDDNNRAIELYLRLGFHTRTPMNFYVLQKFV